MKEDSNISIAPKYTKKKGTLKAGVNNAIVPFRVKRQVTGDFGNLEVSIPGHKLVYSVKQFHFHRPTEHTFQGKYYDIEMHIVHVLESGAPKDYQFNRAVVGIVFDSSKDIPNPFLDSLKHNNETEVDLQGLLKSVPNKLYHYQGSLTTPPCSEVVNWFVYKTPLNISKKQMEELSKIWESGMEGCHNNRDVQGINSRVIYKN